MATAEQMVDTVFGLDVDPDEEPTREETRVPPHDLDAEAAILSLLMHDGEAHAEVSEFLRPEHFYSESHRRICEACYGLAAVGQPVDLVTVMGWLRDRDRLAQVGGPSYLTVVCRASPPAATYTCGACGRVWKVGTSCACGQTTTPRDESPLTAGLGIR